AALARARWRFTGKDRTGAARILSAASCGWQHRYTSERTPFSSRSIAAAALRKLARRRDTAALRIGSAALRSGRNGDTARRYGALASLHGGVAELAALARRQRAADLRGVCLVGAAPHSVRRRSSVVPAAPRPFRATVARNPSGRDGLHA